MWNPESWALESGVQLKESGIPLAIGIENPSSIDKDWNRVPVYPESVTWNLESQTIVDSLTWGDLQVGLLNCFYFYNTEHDSMFSF